MTNLTDLLPAGAGGKQVSFTASGSISQGNTVALQSNGTVKVISSTANAQEAGTAVTFENSALDQYTAAAYDSTNNKVVVAYNDNGDGSKGKCAVGTVSGTSISFGTPVTFDNSVEDVAIAFDENAGKFLVCLVGSSISAKAYVGTVSGTSISFGSDYTIGSGSVGRSINAVYDSTNQKIVVGYNDQVDNYGNSYVATISGTTVSFGSKVTFEYANVATLSSAFDSGNGKVVFFYTDQGNSGKATAVVGTVSGTSISYGSGNLISTGISSTDYTTVVYDSVAQRIVFGYRDGSNSDYGTARVGEISGTAFSMPSPVVFESAAVQYLTSAFDVKAAKTTFAYQDYPNSQQGTAISGTISGSTISFGSTTIYQNTEVAFQSATYDASAEKVVIFYKEEVSNYGTAVVFQNSSSNFEDFIGIADAAISDTASGDITIKGGIASNGLSSLTPGSTYYVQSDGTLSTTSSDVTAGKALSATSINLDYSS